MARSEKSAIFGGISKLKLEEMYEFVSVYVYVCLCAFPVCSVSDVVSVHYMCIYIYIHIYIYTCIICMNVC